ncbi:hypothetical protein Glove_139g115 [Diversispora epigaea]|uniref:Uncharacterized protein n=1 Tax=Diversispora epigaea TaxID=1348612 RepID=A0A397IW10_9GLOM|nr:hypothetical protein Glove_139g115 [Diversispora epigaea]
MIWSKLTQQIQEFQWIYLRDKCLREIMRAIIQKAIEEYNWLIFGFPNMTVTNS